MNRSTWRAVLACTAMGVCGIGCGGPFHPAAPDSGIPSTNSSSTSGGGSGGTDAGVPDAGTPDAGPMPDAGFQVAPHEPFPQVPNNGGPVLDHLQLITITFTGYTYQQQVEGFGDFIVGSQWLKTVGADYGVGSGTSLAKVVLHDTPPASTTDTQIQAYLAQKIQDGTLPPTSQGNHENLYVIYYPSSTTISMSAVGGGGTSCHEFGGYHNEASVGTLHFAYAVIPTCDGFGGSGSVIADLETAVSHELIEAATDPFVNTPGYALLDQTNPWALIPGEVGDLCVGQNTTDGIYAVQRIWSNTAAAGGGSPCVPAPSTPFFGATATPAQTIMVSPGQTATFQVKAWSSARVPAWSVSTMTYQGNFDPQPTVDRAIMNNGDTATLTLTIPANVPSRSYAVILLYSARSIGEYSFWPVAVYIP